MRWPSPAGIQADPKKRRAVAGLLVSMLIAICYVISISSAGSEPNLLTGSLILIWAAFLFRQYARAFELGPLHIPVSPIGFLAVWLFGAIVVAGFGVLLLPFLIARDSLALLAR